MQYKRIDTIYKRVYTLEIGATLYIPQHTCGQTALWIHGGALVMDNRESLDNDYADELMHFLELGVTLVSIDYRLSPESLLSDILEDITDAFFWVLHGCNGLIAEPSSAGSIFLIGHSAGGYLSQLLAATLIQKPSAVISFYGYCDITAKWYMQPSEHYLMLENINVLESTAYTKQQPAISYCPNDLTQLRRKYYIWLRQQGKWTETVAGCPHSSVSEYALQFCPVSTATADYPPTFLVHGSFDTDVPVEQSEIMSRRLGELGVECVFIAIPGEHGFDTTPEWCGSPLQSALTTQLDTFLEKHVLPSQKSRKE